MFLDSFTLPIYNESCILSERAKINGGIFGYVDNPYPCGLQEA